jgi:hypothetical protein
MQRMRRVCSERRFEHAQLSARIPRRREIVMRVTSGWRTVSATAQPQCYRTWTPGSGVWSPLESNSGDVKVYYRRDSADANEKISTEPGSGSYHVPPAYLIVNAAGQP